ncbi:YncE family protein [Novosphingobium sp. M1R2S20]|uniref:YncE family protein n=1 Tax=Novosphingobium rhizovicinum TaxID=3228928 RepID=A0ABV3RG31_9SPHN
MRAFRALVTSFAAGCTALPSIALAQQEEVVPVPGFADFLAVDGNSVWVTNRGRVERWSREGKLAEVPMTRPCGTMSIAYGALWVADCQEKTLNRIDIKTAKRTHVIPTGIGSPDGEMNVVTGAGSVWVATDAEGAISRVDPETNSVVAKVKTKPLAVYLAFGEGALWAVSAKERTLERIDPSTNEVVATVPVGSQPGFLAAGEGSVWVQEQGDGTVAAIDPATNAVRGRVEVGKTLKYGDIDTGGGKVWLRTTEDQMFAVIDPKTLTVTARLGKPSGSGALRYTPAGVWTSAHDLHSLSWWSNPSELGK